MDTADQVVACDYVGIVSANDVPNKFEKARFHPIKSEFINAPLIEKLPMAVECKLINYDEKSCRLVGEIVNICADEKISTDGKISPKKLCSIIYDGINHAYYVLGEKVGNTFKDGASLR